MSDVGAPIPNAAECAGAEGCQPFKFAVLCDNGAGDQPFLRCYQVECPEGTITGFVDLELDGTTPYVLVGDAVVCVGDVTLPAPNIADAELICFDAPPSPLMQVTVYDSVGGVVAGPFFLDPLTGLPAVPGGNVIPCPDNQGFCKILCDGGNGNFEFVRFYTLDTSGVVTTTDVDLDGNPYVVVGPVNDCCEELECIDGEYFVLCDDGTDPATQFLRRYDVSTGGTVTTVDTELDGTTAYVVVGDVAICPIAIDTSLGDEISPGRIRLNGAGASWDFASTAGGRVKSVAVLCLNDGVGGGPGAGSDVTVTDAQGNTFEMNTGETFEWSVDAFDDELVDGATLSVDIGAGGANAYVDVLWTEVV